MVIVKAKGGLGNQLFQYACGRAQALRLGTKLLLSTWDCGVRSVLKRPLYLTQFNVQAGMAGPEDLRTSNTVHENPFTDAPHVRVSGNVILEGFWQSEKYFSDAAAYIKYELEFTDADRMSQARAYVQALRKLRGTPVIAVHVRRGDYLEADNRNRYHNLSLQWYRMAMLCFPPQAEFLVFSDDIAWCRDNMVHHMAPTVRLHFSDGLELEDLARMRACDGYIIANSSFSWWAAWLSDSAQPTVVAPSSHCWFGPQHVRTARKNASHIIPRRWISQNEPTSVIC